MIANAVNRMYRGKMTVTASRKAVQADGETVLEDEVLYTDKPCALSVFSSGLTQKLAVEETDGTYRETARYKIFCDNDFFVPAGSRISVTQEGQSYTFAYSGQAFVYRTHQELVVKRQARF